MEPTTMPLVLSPQQRYVLTMLASGKTEKEIATELCVAPQTIAEHLRRARKKLSARTNAQLVSRSVQLGCIVPIA